MRIITIFILMFFIANTAKAFEVKAISTKKINSGSGTKIEAKLPPKGEFKGRLKGVATIDAEGTGNYYINVSWNEFINQNNNTVTQLDSNKFKSNFVSKIQYIKLNQSIEVQGDLSSVVKSDDTSKSQDDNSSTQTAATNSSGYASPVLGSLSNLDDDDDINNNIEMPKLETSSLECEPVLNLTDSTATMYYQDYLVKQDGSKTVKKPCYMSKEIVKIQYEECDLVHDYTQEMSYRKHSSYIEPKEGRRELEGCKVYGQAIAHHFDEEKCDIKEVNGVAVIYAKRYIVIPDTNQTMYLTDCEARKNEEIQIDLKACDTSLYLIQNEAHMVYPAGRKYIEKDGQRVYVDESCNVLLDYGSTFLTEHTRWEHNDEKRYSNDYWKYLYDFTQYEGGFKADIPDSEYIKSKVDYQIISKWEETGGHCGGGLKNKRWHYYKATYKRGDGSTINSEWQGRQCH